MSLKLSFVLSLIGLVLVLNAAQPTPRPSPRKLPIHPTESTFQHQRGGYAYYGPANAGVPAENQRKSQPTTSITKNAANTENGIKQPDWLTAFTGVLALVAFLQLLTLIAQSLASWRTYKATRSNAKATFRSALAAMRSARVAKLAIQADRPYLLVEKATLTGVVSKLKDQTGLFALLQGEKLNPPNAFFPQPVFTFRNYGKGPALINEIVAMTSIAIDLPIPRDFSACQPVFLEVEGIEPSRCYIVENIYAYNFPGPASDIDQVRTNEKKLFVYGQIRYRSVFDKSVIYDTAFCWIFKPPTPFAIDAISGEPIDPFGGLKPPMLPSQFVRGPATHNYNT